MDTLQQSLLDHLFDNASLYVRALERRQQQFVIQEMSRQAYRSSSFLNERLHASNDLFYLLPMQETLAHFEAQAVKTHPIHFIFHFAFCGSTLLSRCLDHPGHTMVYKEPELLHQISCHLRWPSEPLPDTALLNFAIYCLQRTVLPMEVPIVKPTDSCSNLIHACLSTHPNARGVVLYCTLDRFLSATLKSPRRRHFIRGMYSRAVDDFKAVGITFDPGKASLADAEVSAFVWLSLMFRYRNWLNMAEGRLLALRMQCWLEKPVAVLRHLSTFMALDIPRKLIEQTVESGAFTRDAKLTSRVFDQRAYAQQEEARQMKFHAELTAGKSWAEKFTRAHPLEDTLPHQLVLD
ncbi:MAG: hypothetical protein AAF564_18900 [Bacteroidota bacterium]